MLDNMIGDVARAMQDDRRAQAMQMARVVEAERANLPHARDARRRSRRAAIAKVLMALATRLAQPVPAQTPPDMATHAAQ